VYVIVPPAATDAVADFDNVRFLGVATAVAAFAQLVVPHEVPGAAGLAPPVGSTDA
jgi:hypothetical protein